MLNWPSTIRTLTVLTGLVTCAMLAAAQVPPTTQIPPIPPPPASMQVQPSTLSEMVPDQLSGVDPSKVVRWTLRDAIIAALEKNPDIEINRENVRLAQFDLLSTQGVYGWTAASTIYYNSQKVPNAFRFSGSLQDFVQTDNFTFNANLTKYVESTSGFYQINFNNSRVTSNTSNLASSINPSLTATFTQPLMRNFLHDINRRQVHILRKRLDLSDAQFRQIVIEIINTVQNAYWDLAFAIRNQQIQIEAVNLAQTQLRNNQRQSDVGTLAPIDVVSAAVQVETNRQQAFQAMQIVAQAENTLKTLTVESPQSELWTSKILPVESFEIQPVAFSISEAVNLALTNRPEVKQFALQREINRIDIDFFRNQTKPQVDLIATYGITGLAGTPAITVDQGGVPQPVLVSPKFVGGYFTALGNLFSNAYPTWRVGVNVSFPLHNQTAQANLGRALTSSRQLDEQSRRQLQLIEAEVRNAYQAMQAANLRSGAARAARQYAEIQLAGEQQKFGAGLSTTFLVLQRQTDLSQARGTEVRTMTDYNKAVANLQRAIATTLASNSIDLSAAVAIPDSGGKK